MKLSYDRSANALYIELNKRPYAESDEVSDGVIFDYDRRGQIIGIEILDVSRRFPRSFRPPIARPRALRRISARSPAKVGT